MLIKDAREHLSHKLKGHKDKQVHLLSPGWCEWNMDNQAHLLSPGWCEWNMDNQAHLLSHKPKALTRGNLKYLHKET